MALAVSEGCPSRPALKNENGPRRLLSRTGGRLPALQAVSKPDAKAERERLSYSYLLVICQDLEPQSSQNSVSDIGQLLWRNAPRNKFPLTARTSAPVLKPIKTSSRNGRGHIAFGPYLLSRKRAWQRMQKCKLNMIGHLRVGGCRTQRNNGYKITSSGQSWNNETAKVTQQYFAQFRIIHQRHLLGLSGSLADLKGRN